MSAQQSGNLHSFVYAVVGNRAAEVIGRARRERLDPAILSLVIDHGISGLDAAVGICKVAHEQVGVDDPLQLVDYIQEVGGLEAYRKLLRAAVQEQQSIPEEVAKLGRYRTSSELTPFDVQGIRRGHATSSVVGNLLNGAHGAPTNGNGSSTIGYSSFRLRT